MLANLIHFFLPQTCSICHINTDYLCGTCLKKFNFTPQQSTIKQTKHIYFSDYSNNLKKYISTVKFESYSKAIDPLAEFLKTNICHHKTLSNYDYWVSVPYHPLKLYQRGFNVIKLLFEPLFNELKIPHISGIKRHKYTPSLFNLNKKDRLKKLHGSISLNTKKNRKIKT